MDTGTANTLYSEAFVDELARAGVQHVCISPGSRSTPLALAFAKHPRIRVWMHLDERSCAYFALGMARLSRRPIALLCTSGTAAANFLPAIVEAKYGRVPLVVLTADRPPELRDIGASQTIDQIKLYGDHVKWFLEMPTPSMNQDVLLYARSMASRAVAEALAQPEGPVHLNCPFREPLLPDRTEAASYPPHPPRMRGGEGGVSGVRGNEGEAERRLISAPPQTSADDSYGGAQNSFARSGGVPYTSVVRPSAKIAPESLSGLAAELLALDRGLIICGPQPDASLAASVAKLAGALGYPVLADPLSQVRSGKHDRSLVIDRYDSLLRDERFTGTHQPEAVLRLGAMPVSKPLQQALRSWRGCRQIVVDEAGWRDPVLTASDLVRAEPAEFCESLSRTVQDVHQREKGKAEGSGADSTSPWSLDWKEADQRASETINACFSRWAELFEGRVFGELADLLPDGAALYTGNSMPVRDLDAFFPSTTQDIYFLANRGASGIDGVTSSALGASAVSTGPVVLVTGDLSFYHDLNGLLAAKMHGLDLTVVLINNDGGGIFSFLPQASLPEHFETLFGTPHGLDFSHAVRMYGGNLHQPNSWSDFREAVWRSLRSRGLQVIEVRTDRSRNVALHRQLELAVSEAILDPAPALPVCGEGERTASVESKKLRVNGVSYSYEIRGSGPPALLLHGFTGSLHTWDRLTAELTESSKDSFTVVRLDILGHGLSDSPEDPYRYGMERVTEDVATLLAELGIQRTALLGYSMGGRLALHVAANRPDLVSALVMESGSPGLADAEARAGRARTDAELADFIERAGIDAFVDKWQRNPLFATQASLPASLRSAIREERLRNDPRGLANSLRGMGTGAQQPLWGRLAEIKVPTLLVVGALDSKFRDIACRMAESLPNRELAVVPDAGHTVHHEQPEQFNRIVRGFLQRKNQDGGKANAG